MENNELPTNALTASLYDDPRAWTPKNTAHVTHHGRGLHKVEVYNADGEMSYLWLDAVTIEKLRAALARPVEWSRDAIYGIGDVTEVADGVTAADIAVVESWSETTPKTLHEVERSEVWDAGVNEDANTWEGRVCKSWSKTVDFLQNYIHEAQRKHTPNDDLIDLNDDTVIAFGGEYNAVQINGGHWWPVYILLKMIVGIDYTPREWVDDLEKYPILNLVFDNPVLGKKVHNEDGDGWVDIIMNELGAVAVGDEHSAHIIISEYKHEGTTWNRDEMLENLHIVVEDVDVEEDAPNVPRGTIPDQTTDQTTQTEKVNAITTSAVTKRYTTRTLTRESADVISDSVGENVTAATLLKHRYIKGKDGNADTLEMDFIGENIDDVALTAQVGAVIAVVTWKGRDSDEMRELRAKITRETAGNVGLTAGDLEQLNNVIEKATS